MRVGVEKASGPEVVVTSSGQRADARRLHRDIQRRRRRLVGDRQGAGDTLEPASDAADHKVLSREPDEGVHRVDRVDASPGNQHVVRDATLIACRISSGCLGHGTTPICRRVDFAIAHGTTDDAILEPDRSWRRREGGR